MQAVWKEIAQHTRAERIIFAPSEIEIGIKVFGVVVFDGPAPGVPIDVFLSRVRVDSVIPFALGSVSHVRILAQNELPNFTRADQFSSLVPSGIGAALRADLQNFAGLFYGIVNLESFSEIAGHRLFHIDMLAGIKSIHGAAGVPVIDRGDGYGVDIFSVE